MAPRKKALRPLTRKAVSPKKAAVVKGGARRSDKLATNHNQVTLSRPRR
jgi:hypothetical protein